MDLTKRRALCRRLFRLYGCYHSAVDNCIHYGIDKWGKIRSWDVMQSGFAGWEMKTLLSLNADVDFFQKAFGVHVVDVLDFESFEDLDIQLTLMGENHD